VQGEASRIFQWADHWQVALKQGITERMLFKNTGIAPARGPVKLGHQRAAILKPDAVDPVFITVQRTDAAIGVKANAVDRI